MNREARFVRLLLLAALFMVSSLPLGAQEPECDNPPPGIPVSPGELEEFCTNNPLATCDLEIATTGIRLGDVFSATAERPRFFFDDTGNRFYTKLYSEFLNSANGSAPSSEVTVDFSFKPGSDPAVGMWQALGTYQMHVPAFPHVLFPSAVPHQQQKAICWHMAAGAHFPQQFLVRAVVNWPLGPDGDTTNNEAIRLYDLSTVTRLAQIAFAMDLSGSMSINLPSGFQRLTVAKDRARLFADMIENGNQLGVYGFATGNPGNTPFNSSYEDSGGVGHTPVLQETSVISAIQDLTAATDRDAIRLSIQNQTFHGCTPVGQGLLRAKAAIEGMAAPVGGAGTPGKAIVLFSDGWQNVPPYVEAPPPYGCGMGAPGADIDAIETFTDHGFTIYSIYFGPEVGWAYDLMNTIKMQTGGDYVYGPANGLELAAVYYSIRGLVDDMIYLEEDGTTSPTAPWPEFTVDFDSAATVATVAVAWPYDAGKTRLAVDARRQGENDWQELSPMGQDPVGDVTGTHQLPIPSAYRVFRFDAGPDSTWELRVRQITPRSGSSSYTAAVFSEVEQLQLLPSLDDETFTAGQPLPILAELRSAGHPVLGATVDAVVEVPSRPFSTTLRRYAGRFTAPAVDPDSQRISSMAAQLSSFLQTDEGSGELYLYRQAQVTLRDDGTAGDADANDGVYTGVLSGGETRVAGDYKVTITAEGTLPSGRTAKRLTKLSTIADVGPADIGRSEVEIVLGELTADGRQAAKVRVLPTDQYGNAAFPGTARTIGVSVTGGSLSGGVVDDLDTTFTQNVLVPAGGGAQVTVTVGTQSLGTFPVGTGPSVGQQRREFSLHLALSEPHGRFGNRYSSGPGFALDYGETFATNLAWRIELGLDQFDDPAGGSIDLTSLIGSLQYRWSTPGPWTPYFEGGVGIYDLESVSTASSFSLGVGTYREISSSWDLDLNLRSHRVGGVLDLGYSQLRVGAIFKF